MASFTGERRRSPRRKARFEVCLKTSMSLIDTNVSGDEEPHRLTFFGSTNDISASGLALILPSVRVDERNCSGKDHTLQISLYTSTDMVKMKASIVRCQPLSEREPEKGYFLGAKIIDMADKDRFLFDTHLSRITET